ncbi:MAG: DMT family transporter [Acetobacteraceae bacterium]
MSSTLDRSSNLAGYAYAVAVVLIWAGFSLVGRGAMLADGVRLTPWDLGALRHVVSGAAAAVLLLNGAGRGLPLRRSFVLGTLAGVGFPLPAYLGFTFAPAAHGAVILSGTLPFLVAIGAWAVYGERWTHARLVSLAVLLAGISLLGIEAYVQGARPGAWRGDLLFLLAALNWATYTILARHWAPTPLQAIAAVGRWGAMLYLPVWALALPSAVGAASWSQIAFQAVFQGVFGTVLSLFLFTRALAALGAGRLSLVTAMVPGLAGLLAIPLLGEHMGPLALLGLGLVCLAVALGVSN